MDKKIKYVLTDLDGVIRFFQNKKVNDYERANNIAKGLIHDVYFEKSLLKEVITGTISDEEWKLQITEVLDKQYPFLNANEIVDVVANEDYIINQDALDLYKQYYPNASIVLVTNATSKLRKDLEDNNILSCFDYIFNSSEMGVHKPLAEFYLQIKKDLNFNFDEIIYVDDSKKNVLSAESLGIRSHHFMDFQLLEDFLK